MLERKETTMLFLTSAYLSKHAYMLQTLSRNALNLGKSPLREIHFLPKLSSCVATLSSSSAYILSGSQWLLPCSGVASRLRPRALVQKLPSRQLQPPKTLNLLFLTKNDLLHATLSSASLAVLSPPPLLAHLSSSSSSLSFLLMLTCTHHSVSSSVSSSTEAPHMLSPSSAYTCCTSKKLCFCNCNIFKHSVLLQSNPCLLGFDWVRFLQVVAFFTRTFWEPLLPGSASMAVSHSSSPGTATAVRPL